MSTKTPRKIAATATTGTASKAGTPRATAKVPSKVPPPDRSKAKATRAASTAVPKRAADKRSAKPAPSALPAPLNKQAGLIALLRSAEGGTIDQMTKLTGWQAHTVRGTISGVVRKRLGLKVARTAVPDGASVYRIVEAAA